MTRRAGLSAQVYGFGASQEFVNRFHVNEIGEFYGATEGNIGFWNYWKKGEPHGAIGEKMEYSDS